jgi:hypothetical protein
MPDLLSDDQIGTIANAIAGMVTDRLTASVIPSTFPAGIGELIRKNTSHGAIHSQFVIPLYGPVGLIASWIFNPDGTVNLELRDMTNCTFWRGTFRPADG